MSNRDPRFDPDRRPDAQPQPGRRNQTNMRQHHDIERSPEYFDASYTDEYYPDRYLSQALNWNKRDMTLTDGDHPEVQHQFREQSLREGRLRDTPGRYDSPANSRYSEPYPDEHRYQSRPSRDEGVQQGQRYQQEQTYRQDQDYRGRGPRGYVRSDERIMDEVCDRLNHDHTLDARDILVTCTDGIVTLKGSIENRAMKRRAEDIVDTCNGVRDVDNRLQIRLL